MHVGRVCPIASRETLFGPDADVAIECYHEIGSDICHVRVVKLGPPRKVGGKTGRRRDVPNLLDTLADALQGLVYKDDRQVASAMAQRRADA